MPSDRTHSCRGGREWDWAGLWVLVAEGGAEGKRPRAEADTGDAALGGAGAA